MKYKGDELYWIAICDDEPESVKTIRNILLEGEIEPGEFKISVFSSGAELLNANVSRYDLLILDVVFPGESGRQIAAKYRRRNKNGLFVFCTDKSAPQPEDFKICPYRYLRKGNEARLRDELLDVVEEMYRRRNRHHLILSVGKNNLAISVEDVVYLEIAKNGCYAHYYNRDEELCKVKARDRIKDLYPQIAAYGFEFSHNSYLVNCHYVCWWGSTELKLVDGTSISVSRARESKFRAACTKYIT